MTIGLPFNLDVQTQTNDTDSFAITFAPLSIDEVYRLADDEANGAIVVMSGMVRNNTEGKAVVALEYQAYEPMAAAVFKQISAEIRQQWADITHVVIHHQTGKLTVGEISVLVAVGCPQYILIFSSLLNSYLEKRDLAGWFDQLGKHWSL